MGGVPFDGMEVCKDNISFNRLTPGQILSNISGNFGLGPIAVFGSNPSINGGATNAMVVFDSDNPSGEDPDLGSPNETFGGPGIGLDGEMGMPFENDSRLRKLVILAEDLVDANNDGLVDDPDDADVPGGMLSFDFSAIGPVYIERITVIDVEPDKDPSNVDFFGPGGAFITNIELPVPGDNGFVRGVPLNVPNVESMVINVNGSGGFDNIVFEKWRDCNGNGVRDRLDIRNGTSQDCNDNGIPDECEPDCDADGIPDDCEADCNMNGTPDDCEGAPDCNSNGIPDECDIAGGTSDDCQPNGVPDECEPDCDMDGIPDDCEADCDANGTPDDCEPFVDCNSNGVPDRCDIADGTSEDCQPNGIPDECEPDCNSNGVPDDCDIASGTSSDCDTNGTPDECEAGSIGDTVFCDDDDDGILDPGEPGIAGVVVDLQCAGPDCVLGTGDDVFDSTMTDGSGNYSFDPVPPGDCTVSVDPSSAPPGKIPGKCPLEFTITLAANEDFLDADFCFVQTGEIGDTVFCDLDGDGIQDFDEPGIPDVILALVCAGDDGVIGTADDYVDSAVTDANGNYLFTDVPPGPCEVSVDASSAPDPKVPGACPMVFMVDLDPGESFLDADFCFENPPPSDCCEFGKPRRLTFIYTGEDCSATTHSQDAGKVNCSGDPAFATRVQIRGTDKEDPNDLSGNIWFDGEVDLDQAFTLDALDAGETKLANATFIHIFDLVGNLLQSVEFHTSCSQPLFTFDQFGASLLIDCEGEDEPIEGDCCVNGKPRQLTFTYTGEGCTATSHSQDSGKVSCAGDPGFAGVVHIRGTDEEDPTDTTGRIWFEGDVLLGENFTLDADNEDESRLSNATFIHIFDPSGNVLLQTVEFHTSCSQPLFLGNQFGASLLVDCVGEDEPGPPGSADSCDDGDPQVLIMRYTGEDCGATNHGQDPGKVNCSGDPMFEPTVFIRSTDDEDPNDTSGKVWFEGNVVLEGQFDIDATRGGDNSLKSSTFVHVFDLSDNLLQTIEFHTSCSQPLSVGDQFGSVVLDVFIPE